MWCKGDVPSCTSATERERLSVDTVWTPFLNLRSFCMPSSLARVDVLQFMDVEALFLVSLREENDGDPKVLATVRIQTDVWQTVHGAAFPMGLSTVPSGVPTSLTLEVTTFQPSSPTFSVLDLLLQATSAAR